jgi:peptide/nickel transport system permease protein
VFALSLHAIAAIVKQTREAMLEALASEYVRMSRANGVSRRAILFPGALKNTGVRVVTVLGLQAVGLLGGTVIVESVFGLPGLGSLAVNATLQHDLPLIQGIVVYFTIIVVIVNLVIDLAYTWLNPRVRTQ